MPSYRVVHGYRSDLDDEQHVLIAGQVVEVDEARAARLNTDSPGVLVPVEVAKPTTPEADRQDTGAVQRAEPTPKRGRPRRSGG